MRYDFSKWRPHCIYIKQTYLLLHASHSGMRHWASAYSEGTILKDRSSFVGGSQTCKLVRGQRFLSKICILLSWVKRYYKTIHNGYFLDGLTIFSWLFVKKTFINITSNVANILVETLFFSTNWDIFLTSPTEAARTQTQC